MSIPGQQPAFLEGATSLKSGRPIKEADADARSLARGELRARYAGSGDVLLDDEGAAWDVASGEAALRAFAHRVFERRHHDH